MSEFAIWRKSRIIVRSPFPGTNHYQLSRRNGSTCSVVNAAHREASVRSDLDFMRPSHQSGQEDLASFAFRIIHHPALVVPHHVSLPVGKFQISTPLPDFLSAKRVRCSRLGAPYSFLRAMPKAF